MATETTKATEATQVFYWSKLDGALPSPETIGNSLVFFESNCFCSAKHNLEHFWKNMNLHLVAGSLGIQAPEAEGEVYWLYGDPIFTKVEDFVSDEQDGEEEDDEKSGSILHFDVHVWLEDTEGNVFDVVDIQQFEKDTVAYKLFDSSKRFLIAQKHSKEAILKSCKLVYHPALEEIQQELLKQVGKRSTDILQDKK